jgi:hypothetical protein
MDDLPAPVSPTRQTRTSLIPILSRSNVGARRRRSERVKEFNTFVALDSLQPPTRHGTGIHQEGRRQECAQDDELNDQEGPAKGHEEGRSVSPPISSPLSH